MTYVLSRKPDVGVGQPPGDLLLDRSHPLTEGLILSCYNAVSDMEKPPRNYVNGTTGTRSGVRSYGPAVAANAYFASSLLGEPDSGRRQQIINAAKFNGSTSWAFIDLNLAPYPVITVALWMAVLANETTLALEYNSDLQNNGFGLSPYNIDGTPVSGPMILDGWLPSAYNLRTISPPPALKTMHHYLFIDRRSNAYTAHDLFIDGCAAVPFRYGTGTAGSAFAANGGLNIGARNHGASAFANVGMCCLQIWDHALTVEEAQDYYRNTWQIFRPAVCSVGETS